MECGVEGERFAARFDQQRRAARVAGGGQAAVGALIFPAASVHLGLPLSQPFTAVFGNVPAVVRAERTVTGFGARVPVSKH